MNRRTFIKSSVAVPAAVGILAGCESETESEAESPRNSLDPLTRTDWGTVIHGQISPGKRLRRNAPGSG